MGYLILLLLLLLFLLSLSLLLELLLLLLLLSSLSLSIYFMLTRCKNFTIKILNNCSYTKNGMLIKVNKLKLIWNNVKELKSYINVIIQISGSYP